MVTADLLGLLAVLVMATVYDTRRRRRVLDANLPAGVSRAVRRRILREQRTQDRATRADTPPSTRACTAAGDAPRACRMCG